MANLTGTIQYLVIRRSVDNEIIATWFFENFANPTFSQPFFTPLNKKPSAEFESVDVDILIFHITSFFVLGDNSC